MRAGDGSGLRRAARCFRTHKENLGEATVRNYFAPHVIREQFFRRSSIYVSLLNLSLCIFFIKFVTFCQFFPVIVVHFILL